MLHTFQRIMMVAIAAMSAAAIGQAEGLKVEVPFEFKAGQAQMAPGVYYVNRDTSRNAPVYSIRNEATRKSIGVMAQEHSTARAVDKAVLQFRCVSGRCELAKIETPGIGASSFPASKRSKEAAGQQVAMIRIPAL